MKLYRSIVLMLVVIVSFSSWSCTTLNDRYSVAGGIESITKEELSQHLSYLASDELEGRDTGSRGIDLAADYIAAEMTKIGLEPAGENRSYFQEFDLLSRRILPATHIDIHHEQDSSRQFGFNEDFFLYPTRVRQNEIIRGDLIFAGYGISAPEYDYDDYAGIEVEGKIVLVLGGEPREDDENSPFDGISLSHHGSLRNKLQLAEEKGARAVITVSTLIDSSMDFKVYYSRFLKYASKPKLSLADQAVFEEEPMDLIIASREMTDYMLLPAGLSVSDAKAQIDSTLRPISQPITPIEFELDLSLEIKNVRAKNVLGMVVGSDSRLKDETVVYSAHYDHVGIDDDGEIFNGADDDASGCSALLEIAEAFARAPQKPRRSVMFIWFSAEEKGLLGSKYYVERPSVSMENTIVNLNIDMIGRVRQPDDRTPKNASLAEEKTVYIVGGHQSPQLKAINENVSRELGLVIDYTYNDINHPKKVYYRSDHYNFARKGVPVLFYTTGEHVDYHQVTDTIEKIDFGKIQKTATLAFLTGWRVANQKERLKVQKISKTD